MKGTAMSLEFNTTSENRKMIVRVSKNDLDSLPIDNIFGNLNSLLVTLTGAKEVHRAQEYIPRTEASAIVGALMADGSEAYRLEVEWHFDANFNIVKERVQTIWTTFSKEKGHEIENPQQAVYTADGEFDYFIGA